MIKTIKKNVRNIIFPLVKARPDFLILGAQKAGTTSLYHYLVQHPKIYERSTFKEVRYFDRNVHYDKGFGWYLSNFPYRWESLNQLNCDASPNYLYYDFVPALLNKELGAKKMICILREPSSRAYSAWRMFNSFDDIDNDHLRRFNDPRSFREAIEEEFSEGFDYNKYPFRFDYVGRGEYAKQINKYYDYFPKELLLIIEASQLLKAREKTLEKVCSFLEIDDFPEEIKNSIKNEKFNVGLAREKTEEEKHILSTLKDYYIPHNQKLYELIGQQFDW